MQLVLPKDLPADTTIPAIITMTRHPVVSLFITSTHTEREVAKLRFHPQPISVLVKKGHRLRVAIVGHDKDTFIFRGLSYR
ncbi:MAG TPA: CocE/NonD family hydrolase C-terminal non-catalytic domain-containing protein [Pyrinomonadaceae bacterium]|nr:CocE/NonD family hydrolase C-terminal non-catalytic domain-containing protein [Pyrinomonadaceae bacterium]